jgi:hypothetical protein
VPRVRGRGPGGADPPGPRRHHLRVQARRRREIQQGDQPRRRPVPGRRSRCASCSNPTATSARPRSSPSRSARRFTASRSSPISRRCRIC